MQTNLGRTLGELLALLRGSRLGTGELPAAWGITDKAVRGHLSAMQRDGLVQAVGVQRGTGGKPALLYEITPEAEERFAKAYARVLSELVDVLEDRFGPDGAVTRLREARARAPLPRDRSTPRGTGCRRRRRSARSAGTWRSSPWRAAGASRAAAARSRR